MTRKFKSSRAERVEVPIIYGPPTPIFGYCEEPDEFGTIFRYAFRVDGEISDVDVDIHRLGRKTAKVRAELRNGDSRQSEEFSVKPGSNIYGHRHEVHRGTKLTLSLLEDDVKAGGVWVSFEFRPRQSTKEVEVLNVPSTANETALEGA